LDETSTIIGWFLGVDMRVSKIQYRRETDHPVVALKQLLHMLPENNSQTEGLALQKTDTFQIVKPRIIFVIKERLRRMKNIR